jgi:ribonuclease R
MQGTAEEITFAERRAMAAERDATDRYVAAFLADRVGAEFSGRITGVTRFGLFVAWTRRARTASCRFSKLGDEYFIHDDRMHALVGERTGARWPLGMTVDVRLAEAKADNRRPAVRDAERARPARPDGAAPPAWACAHRGDRRPGGGPGGFRGRSGVRRAGRRTSEPARRGGPRR